MTTLLKHTEKSTNCIMRSSNRQLLNYYMDLTLTYIELSFRKKS